MTDTRVKDLADSLHHTTNHLVATTIDPLIEGGQRIEDWIRSNAERHLPATPRARARKARTKRAGLAVVVAVGAAGAFTLLARRVGKKVSTPIAAQPLPAEDALSQRRTA